MSDQIRGYKKWFKENLQIVPADEKEACYGCSFLNSGYCDTLCKSNGDKRYIWGWAGSAPQVKEWSKWNKVIPQDVTASIANGVFNSAKWLRDNLIPVPAGGVGNCSACVFRGTNYCKSISPYCLYFDRNTNSIQYVNWISKGYYANVGMWTEFAELFKVMAQDQIGHILTDIVKTTKKTR